MKSKWNRLVLLLSICLCVTSIFAQNGIIRGRQFGSTVENTFDHILPTLDKGYFATSLSYGEPYSKFIKYDSALNQQWYKQLSYRQIFDAAQTADSGYIITGGAKWVHQGSDDVWIARFDKAGNQLWEAYWGGNKYDIGKAIRILPNGNFLVLGVANSNDGDVLNKTTTDPDIWLLELSALNGSIVTQRIYGGTASEGNSIAMQLAPDGGIVFTTTTYSNDGLVSGNHGSSDAWIVKLDNAYNFLFGKSIGGSGNDRPLSIKSTADGYVVGGITTSMDGDLPGTNNTDNGFVLKTDLAGNLLWQKVIGSDWYDEIRGIAIAANNDILVAGYITKPLPEFPFPDGHDYEEALVFRMDQAGNIKWSRSIGSNSIEMGNDILEASNGNIILAGLCWYNSNNGDFLPSIITPSVGESRGFILEMRNLNSIRGIAFYDNNNNNIKDAGEAFFTQGSVRSNKGSFQVTNLLNGGKFLISVDTGSYSTKLINAGLDTTQFRAYPKSRVTNFTGYGQTDSFAYRVVPTALIKDLDVSITRLTNIYIDNGVKYRIRIKNLGGATKDNAVIKLSARGKAAYHSSTIPVSSIAGDTISWEFASFAGFRKDSIDVILKTATFPAVQLGDSLIAGVVAAPYGTDTDPSDNIAFNTGIIAGQNSAITNQSLQISVTDSARLTRPVQYTLRYNFQSLLDSTKGSVRVIRSAKTSFVSAIPSPTIIDGDTLTWNFKDLAYNNTDTIRFMLRINDTPSVMIGDLIRHDVRLLFNTIDTTVLQINQRINQTVRGYFTAVDTVTTTLKPPAGVKWSRVYGGSGQDWANDVLALPDSGFIVVGATTSTNADLPGTGSQQSFISRFDKDGRVVWRRMFGGSPVTDELFSVKAAGNQTFFAAGIFSQFAEAWVVKFNLNGDTLWTKKITGNSQEYARSVIPLPDGGCIFTGNTNSSNMPGWVNPSTGSSNDNILIVRLDNLGNVVWQNCYTDGVKPYFGNDIITSLDGNYVIAGYREAIGTPHPNSHDGIVLKIDVAGNKLWETKFTFSNYFQQLQSVREGADASLYVSGTAGDGSGLDTAYRGSHGSLDVLVAKLDKDGQRLWTKYFGGIFIDYGKKMNFSSDGSLLVAAQTTSNNGNVTNQHGAYPTYDAWVLKVDTSGNLIWQKTVGGNGTDVFESVAELEDNNIIAAGYTQTNNNGDIHGWHGQKDALISKIGSTNFIVGKVYYDKNNNGIKDANEPVRTTGFIKVTKGGLTYGADLKATGYSISVDTGSYVISLVSSDTANFNVVPATDTSVFTTFSNIDTVDFRLIRKVDIQDLRIDVLPLTPARPGFNAKYSVKYENKGNLDIASASIKIIKDSKTTYVGSTLAPSQISGDTLIWNFSQIEFFSSGSFTLELKVRTPPAANFGDSVRLYAEIQPIAGDTLPADNKRRIAQLVLGSYDPNDKQELHGRSLTATQLQSREYLDYLIRFQNTGNDTAFNVFVRDTLDVKLDWNTFEMIGASHNYNLSIQDGNKLEWYFSNILLPDSNRNEPASHGYIAFRIRPKANLQVGDTIRNTAAIYFDFNQPVQTNVAATVIVINTALPASLLEFSAKPLQQNKTLLSWTVLQESKVAHYIVEHSVNGIDFTPLGSVKSVNSNNRYSYSFIDQRKPDSVNYYRLKIVDADNSFTYSKTIVLKYAGNVLQSLQAYPNPANNMIKLLVNQPVKGYGTLTVLDMNGRAVRTSQLGYMDKTFAELPVNLHGLSGGTYFIRLRIGEQVFGVSVIKY
ncbi:MAG: T9SS type A sorting domain-containing protein [Chitinophagaceae bacterium]